MLDKSLRVYSFCRGSSPYSFGPSVPFAKSRYNNGMQTIKVSGDEVGKSRPGAKLLKKKIKATHPGKLRS